MSFFINFFKESVFLMNESTGLLSNHLVSECSIETNENGFYSMVEALERVVHEVIVSVEFNNYKKEELA